MNHVLSKKVNNFFYFIFVFLSIMSLSSWNQFHTFLNFSSMKIIISLLVIIIIGLFANWNIKRLVLETILLLMAAIYYYLYKDTYIIPVLLAVVAGSGMEFKQILNVDFKSRIVSVLFVIGLSLFSVLPKSGDGAILTGFHFTKYCYGFTYPNILGFQIAVLTLEFIIIYAGKLKFRYLTLWVLLSFLFELLLNYETGSAAILIGVCTYYFLSKKIVNRTIRYGAYLMLVLTVFSVFIAENYNSMDGNWFNFNTLLSYRPEIWQYYLNAMPIKLFGNLQTINQKTIGVVGFGAFDGAYLQFLLLFGVIGIGTLILLVWLISFKKGLKEYKKLSLVLLIPIIFTGFTETNGFLVTYGPTFFLIGSLLIQEMDLNKSASLTSLD
ncbi:hypothetical protein [Pediococcus pentosaceus]|uniref:hypothetical protein n=1 Tax=Pediococcus pentosaceus TaxID=1255 RepID=UPI000C06F98A|nr:hypothetical protein [Pediococcus pentosaceus]